MPPSKHFIDVDKLETILEELQELLFKKHGLNPLERDIILKIALRQESKLQQRKDLDKTKKESAGVVQDLMQRAGMLE